MNDGVLIGLGFFAGWCLKMYFSRRAIRRKELEQRAEIVSKNILGFMRNHPSRNCDHDLYIAPELKPYVIPRIKLNFPSHMVDDTPGQLIIIINPTCSHFKRTWCIPYRTKERHKELRNGRAN